MTPALKLAFSLVLSLLLWLPTVPSALANSEDPYRIALRYLIALLVSRVGVGLFFRIVGGFIVEEPEPEPEEQADPHAQAGDELGYGRRREDDFDMPLPREEDLLDEALEEAADSAALVPVGQTPP